MRQKQNGGHINMGFLRILASLAEITARIGAGAASSWGKYQPELPKEMSR